MRKLNVVIVDDEKMASEGLLLLLTEFCETVNVIGIADGVFEGIKMINEKKPDLVFLDVEMPQGTGFDLLDALSFDVSVIFTTAHAKYAIKAIKTNPIDYLLKPIDVDELITAVNKVTVEQVQSPPKEVRTKITLKTVENIYVVNIKDIIRCESDGNYTRFFLTTGDVILVSKILKEYETKLEEHHFFRVHQSHLINIDHLIRLDKTNGTHAVMLGEEIIPVSTRKKDLLINRIEGIS